MYPSQKQRIVMKNLLCTFCLLLFLISCSGYQFITPDQGMKEYIETQPHQKDKAFDISMEWVAKSFNSANDVIQLKDKENGTIIIQAQDYYYYDFLNTQRIDYRYSVEVKVKDQKIKVIFTTYNTLDGTPPQEGDLPKIAGKYITLKTSLINYLKNYKDDNF